MSYVIAEQIFGKKKVKSLIDANNGVYIALFEIFNYVGDDLVWETKKGHNGSKFPRVSGARVVNVLAGAGDLPAQCWYGCAVYSAG